MKPTLYKTSEYFRGASRYTAKHNQTIHLIRICCSASQLSKRATRLLRVNIATHRNKLDEMESSDWFEETVIQPFRRHVSIMCFLNACSKRRSKSL